MRKDAKRDLGDACVDEAMKIVAAEGIEALSLREVARRLGVSHQAPYKHFRNRDHLLAELVQRCFRDFAAALLASRVHEDALANMHALGQTYLRYAHEHPLEYRLMFGTPWPEAADDPELLCNGRFAFDVLRESLAAVNPKAASTETVDLDAMFVWSAMHGLATILESNAMERLDFDQDFVGRVVEHTMQRVDRGLGLQVPPPAPRPASSPRKRRKTAANEKPPR